MTGMTRRSAIGTIGAIAAASLIRLLARRHR